MEKLIKVDLYKNDDNSSDVLFSYENGIAEKKNYQVKNILDINSSGCRIKNSIIKNLNVVGLLNRQNNIIFDDCIFTEKIDLSLHKCKMTVLFKNCIFLHNFQILGDFENIFTMEQCTFFDSKINFQECSFEHFVFRIVTLHNSIVCLQQTIFYSSEDDFSNLRLFNSKMDFTKTNFSRNADLLNMLGVVTDNQSEIRFNMVDLSFGEVRLFNSKIHRLEFIDCTFECNRFDFDCECNTLIFQNCSNFKIMSFVKLRKLNELNIYNFVNTGRVLVNQDPENYIKSIKTQNNLIWLKAREYREPVNEDYLNQLNSLVRFYDERTQPDYVSIINKEIKRLQKMEEIKTYANEGMKIFISYSWNDEKIADGLERRFKKTSIPLIRDKHEIDYKSSIKEFMKKIRTVDFALIVISDDYLKSANCMYEISEFIKDDDYNKRILPIVKSGTKIFDVKGRYCIGKIYTET